MVMVHRHQFRTRCVPSSDAWPYFTYQDWTFRPLQLWSVRRLVRPHPYNRWAYLPCERTSKLFIKIDNPVSVLACNSTLSHCLRECREFWLRSGMSVVLSVGRREPCSTVYQLACSVAAKLQ